jgi:hypothetical protein
MVPLLAAEESRTTSCPPVPVLLMAHMMQTLAATALLSVHDPLYADHATDAVIAHTSPRTPPAAADCGESNEMTLAHEFISPAGFPKGVPVETVGVVVVRLSNATNPMIREPLEAVIALDASVVPDVLFCPLTADCVYVGIAHLLSDQEPAHRAAGGLGGSHVTLRQA